MNTQAKNATELTFDEVIFGESTLQELEADLQSIHQLEDIAVNGRIEIGNVVKADGIYLNSRGIRTFGEENPVEELMRLATWKRDVLLAIEKRRQHPESGIQGIFPKKEPSEFEIDDSEVIFVEHNED